jgi:transposase-like protein
MKHVSIVNTATDQKKSQDDISLFGSWSDRWLMPFNIPKCKTLHIGAKNLHLPYHLKDQQIQEVTEECDLGSHLQQYL